MNNIRKIRGYLLIVTGLLACPCHLPITLPLLLALTAGTALGVLLANNIWVIVAVSTMCFVIALALGWRTLTTTEGSTCPMPDVSRAISQSELKLE
ncbi:MAG: hypothetical protein M1132_04530 [Chloroflexi bacterium]|nr:hypothetical protein [Chloroflexota bacterium]